MKTSTVKSPSSQSSESSPRSTHERLRKLTSETSTKSEPLVQKCMKALFSFLSQVTLRFFRAKNSMCKYYGHVIVDRRWKTEFPTCYECGAEIRSKAELRTALLKPEASAKDKELAAKGKKDKRT